MAETIKPVETTKDESEARYKVVKGDFGAFPLGSVFTEPQFKSLHTLANAKDSDRDAYHDGLLHRGISLGTIVPTQDKATPIEAGPFNPKASSIMDGIRASQREVDANKANLESVKQSDLAARTGEKK